MELEQQNPLATEKIGTLLARFAVPSVIAMLVGAMYNIVDQIFIGQGVGMLGNAATNVAFPLTTVNTALALLLGLGGAANFNLALGEGRKEAAAKYVGNAVTMLLVAGSVLCVVVLLLIKPLMLLFGATPDVFDYSVSYTSITALGFPFLIFSNGASNLIRADGSPRYSMFCVLAGAVLNTILDPLFIFVFGMGVAGAALATVIGQVVSAVMAAAYLLRYKTVKLDRAALRLEKSSCRGIVSLGAAGCFNQLAIMVVQVVMNNVLTHYGAQSSYGSEIPLACAGIIAKVNMIFLSLVIGISQGMQPIIGFNYGAKNYARVRETYRLAISIATGISVCGFLCFQLFPREIISIFGSGSDAYFHFAERYFRIFLFMTFLNGIQPVTANFFTSIGKAVMGIFMSLTRQIIFLLPLILIFPLLVGIDGIMYAGPVADLTAGVLAFILIKREFGKMRLEEAAAAQK